MYNTDDIFISSENKKLGKIKNFSLPHKISCPGKSEWCEKYCYVTRYYRRFEKCRNAYTKNFEISKEDSFTVLMINKLKKINSQYLRIHTSGDFYSTDYINKWIEICKKLPEHNFWCYTRSWIIPKLFKEIKKLNKIKNIQIFLSSDPTMSPPPKDFRIAFIESDKKANGIYCFHDKKLKKNCRECMYCFKDKKENIIFKIK